MRRVLWFSVLRHHIREKQLLDHSKPASPKQPRIRVLKEWEIEGYMNSMHWRGKLEVTILLDEPQYQGEAFPKNTHFSILETTKHQEFLRNTLPVL